jgi:hypothetical protein
MPVALSSFLVLILVGMEFAAVINWRKQKETEKVRERASSQPPKSQDPFEAADERN